MPSVTDICNGALQKLGAQRITSIDDTNSKNARACKACYERLRDARLRSYFWSFAIKRANLAASVDEPLFGPTNSFPLPSDFLKTAPPDKEMNFNYRDRRIEGRSIVTDEAGPLQIRYIRKVTDPNDMDPLFIDALSCDMALEMCEELTQSNTKKQILMSERKAAVDEAKRVGAIEKPPGEPAEDTWVTVRDS